MTTNRLLRSIRLFLSLNIDDLTVEEKFEKLCNDKHLQDLVIIWAKTEDASEE